jgi:proteasome lid subunit RPN8/RPN11
MTLPGVEWTDEAAQPLAEREFGSIFSPDVTAAIDALPAGPVVVLPRPVARRIAEHAAGEPEREVLGVLFGRAVRDRRRCRVATIVEQAEPMTAAIAGPFSVQATAAGWAQLWRHWPAAAHVIGWYHSHPGMGLFFSATDRQTQRDFFAAPWQVGLVVDPLGAEGEPAMTAYLGADACSAPLLLLAEGRVSHT